MAQAFLNTLNTEQMSQIDAASMRLLSEVGMEVASPEVREILKGAGCECEGIRVRFPIDLVRESINLAPESFEIEGLNPDKKVRIGDGNSHIQPMVGRLHILERSGNRRRTGLQDVRNIVAICEALPAYDILHGGAVMPDIEGVPAGLAHVAGFVETVRQTGKPFKGSCRGKQVAEDCLRLAEAVREGTGNAFSLHTTCNLVSPLQMAAHMSEGALSYVRKGWPVDFASEPQMGATSPVTLAATASLVIAESLAGLVLAQVVNPGTPVFVGTVGAAMDMRHATIALGGIEAALLNAAHAQMAAYYGLPSRGSGSNTNAKLLDFQAGYEKMMTLLIPILAGIDMVFYPGTLEHAETVSLESLVLDNTLCEIALHAQAGVHVSEELLSVDLIKQAGPGGVFLNSRQTAFEMFTEHLVHGLWDRRKRSDWVADGSPTPVHKANAVIEEILGETRPHLPNEVEAKLFEVVSDIAARENALHLVELLWPRKTR